MPTSPRPWDGRLAVPRGHRLFDVVRVLLCLLLILFLGAPSTYAQQPKIHPLPLTGRVGDDTITFAYDPAGTWALEHPSDDNGNSKVPPIIGYGFRAASDFFVWPRPNEWSYGIVDVYNPTFVFDLNPEGWTSIRGGGAKPGLSGEEVSQLLTFTGGIFLGGGAIEFVDMRVVPEPTSLMLLLAGMPLALRMPRPARPKGVKIASRSTYHTYDWGFNTHATCQ